VDIVKDEAQLRIPSVSVSLKEGREFGRKLLSFLLTFNKRSSTVTGIGIAAPQVGRNITVCVVDPFVMVNPVIAAHSEEQFEFAEGCLSFPGMVSKTWRWKWVTVHCDNWKEDISFCDRGGGISRLECAAVQHEIDHLLSTLIFDRADKSYRNIAGW
jgi:peptide deformylase